MLNKISDSDSDSDSAIFMSLCNSHDYGRL